jgi:hypothetical protein
VISITATSLCALHFNIVLSYLSQPIVSPDKWVQHTKNKSTPLHPGFSTPRTKSHHCTLGSAHQEQKHTIAPWVQHTKNKSTPLHPGFSTPRTKAHHCTLGSAHQEQKHTTAPWVQHTKNKSTPLHPGFSTLRTKAHHCTLPLRHIHIS